jgi:pimeloyl-ACP methyl ester carboxylesterase
VHGTGSSSARWVPVLPLLEVHFTIYALDRRGRGESGDGAAYAIEREFEDVAAVVDSIGQPCSLLGHSYGGICSLEAALLTPQLGKLVLYEPPIPIQSEPIYSPGIIERLESLAAAREYEKVLGTFAQEVVRMPAHELEALQKSPSWPARLAAAPTLPRELRAHERYRFDPERFRNFSVPTLLLVGGDSPRFFKAAIDLLHASLTDSRMVVLSGQQHIAMETAPELFADEIAKFLRE